VDATKSYPSTLKSATYVGVGSVLLSLVIGVNIHGPSVLLIFLRSPVFNTTPKVRFCGKGSSIE